MSKAILFIYIVIGCVLAFTGLRDALTKHNKRGEVQEFFTLYQRRPHLIGALYFSFTVLFWLPAMVYESVYGVPE